ncbi:PAS domain S-box protein [Halostella salina]|uniref:PAS domain S-box protein n=1 Tax=Halostella salina TaxID=1547897 RepID=UPI000EF83F25|nr:PAS domain S-box protein [Halostella salina]
MSSKYTVLHVDRAAADREAVETAFAAVGATVVSCTDAASAAAALAESSFDCVVAGDFDEPFSLHDLAEPPVVHFADADASFAGEAVAAGAAGFVPKGDGVETLVERVDAVVGDRASRPTDADRRRSLLVEQSPLAIIEWDREFRVAGWNPAAEERFGYDREDAMGRTAVDLMVPATAREAVESVWEDLLSGEGGRRLVNENVCADGSRIVCEWNNAPLITDAGEVVGVISFVRDVSDQVRRTEALEAVQRTAREMMRAGTKREVAGTLVDAVPALLDRRMASVRLYDEDEGTLDPVATTDRVDELVDELPVVGPGDGVIWDAFEGNEHTVYDAVPVSETVYGDQLPEPVDGLSLFPLGDHGVLVLAVDETEAFDETDLHLANVVAATTEAALDSAERQRELAYRDAIVEAAGDGVYALSPENRYTAVNDTLLSMTGYERDELVGEPPTKLLSPAAVERGRELVAELVAGEGSVRTYEATVYAKDGERIPCEINLSLLPADGEGGPGVVGTVRDITEHKRMEAALRQQQRKVRNLHQVTSRLERCDTTTEVYHAAIEAAERVLDFDACVAYRAADGDLTAAAGGLERSGDEGERPHGELAAEVWETGTASRVGDAERTDARLPGEYRSALTVPVGADGVLQALSSTADAFDDDDQELAELLVAHVVEAIERVRFERDLREQRDRFAALFENVPNPVISVEYEGEVPEFVAANEAFEREFGYEADRVVGEPVTEVVVPPDRRFETDEIVARATAGETVEREVTRLTATGKREFLLTVVPVDPDAENTDMYAIYTDITERKRRRKRVEVLNRVLRHDLRNGMNVVKGYAETLRDAVPPARERAVEAIEERATELSELAEKTRTVQRTLADDREAGPVDAAEAVRDAVDGVGREHPDADVTWSVPDSAPVQADDLFGTAVRQLVENAVVHNDRSPPSVRVEVDDDGETVVVTVRDDGPGIPTMERELLVEDREITQLRHASGLGLWLVNWVAERADGDLSFAENDPRGTVVTLRVPRAAAEAEPADEEAAGD